jgi:hypothetical protein
MGGDLRWGWVALEEGAVGELKYNERLRRGVCFMDDERVYMRLCSIRYRFTLRWISGCIGVDMKNSMELRPGEGPRAYRPS